LAVFLVSLLALTQPVSAQPPQFSMRANTGNDTLYVGLPGAVVLTATGPQDCIEALNWWCEWTITNGVALGDLRRPANPAWSTEASQAFEFRQSNLLVNLTSPETTIVIAEDLASSAWQSAGEICRFEVVPRNAGTISFSHQFTVGPPTWQTTVDLCGGGRVIPVFTSPDITLMPCASGQLVGGDVDFTRNVNIADIMYLIGMVFKATPAPSIPNLGDANCDFTLSGADIIQLVSYLYRGGPPPCDPCLTVAQNDLPETYVHMDTLEVIQPNSQSARVVRPRTYYSLPAPTSAYPGVPVSWSASDSLDYLTTNPQFDFNWALFGPFADKATAHADSAYLVRTNDSLNTPALEWTTDTSHAFFDLRTGWYLFWVRSRDDSLAADTTPSMVRFRVVEPTFERPYMLMDATNWLNGQLLNAGSYGFREARTDSLTLDTLRLLYEDLFSSQGYTFENPADVWYRQLRTCADCYALLPDRSILGTYKALVIYDEDMQIPLDADNMFREYELTLTDYMNVGGRVVLIGRNLFGRSVAGWSNYANPIEATFTPADWAFNYFGLTRMFFPGHLSIALRLSKDTADFMNTIALDPAFPPIFVDTNLTIKLSQLPVQDCQECIDRDGNGETNWLWVPDVNWVGIDSSRGAAGVYQFVSELPNTSPSEGRRCAAKFVYYDSLLAQNTPRSAIVTFPLSTMVRDDSLRQLAKGLLDFILTDTVPASMSHTWRK